MLCKKLIAAVALAAPTALAQSLNDLLGQTQALERQLENMLAAENLGGRNLGKKKKKGGRVLEYEERNAALEALDVPRNLVHNNPRNMQLSAKTETYLNTLSPAERQMWAREQNQHACNNSGGDWTWGTDYDSDECTYPEAPDYRVCCLIVKWNGSTGTVWKLLDFKETLVTWGNDNPTVTEDNCNTNYNTCVLHYGCRKVSRWFPGRATMGMSPEGTNRCYDEANDIGTGTWEHTEMSFR